MLKIKVAIVLAVLSIGCKAGPPEPAPTAEGKKSFIVKETDTWKVTRVDDGASWCYVLEDVDRRPVAMQCK